MVDSGLILYPVKQELAGWKWIPWFQSKGCGILEQHGQGFFFLLFCGGSVQERKQRMFSINPDCSGENLTRSELVPKFLFYCAAHGNSGSEKKQKTAGMRTSRTDLSTRRGLSGARPWPSPRAFLPASRVSVHSGRNDG